MKTDTKTLAAGLRIAAKAQLEFSSASDAINLAADRLEELAADAERRGPFGCKCTTLAHHVAGDGCSECNPMLHAEILADRQEELERELAAKDAHADEIYKAAVDLAAKLEGDLATERALADSMAETLANVQGDYANEGTIVLPEVDTALATWKQARGKEA